MFRILSFSLMLFASACISKPKEENNFPKLKNVKELRNTDFVACLTTPFKSENNLVYAVTIPIVWNKIKNEIGQTITNFSSKELEQLNSFTSYKDVLNPNEYQCSAEITEGEIKANANFKKLLPFAKPLEKFHSGLKFGNHLVESFGFLGESSTAQINYFNSSDKFSISLFPENKEHEIILIMHQDVKSPLNSFSEYLEVLEKESNFDESLAMQDKIDIPCLRFNLGKNYDEFIGSTFNTPNKTFEIISAYQRNAFVLNEKGAEVESEAYMAVTESIEETKNTYPKMMIFNKPFVIFLNRKDAKHPYFGVFVQNTELMLSK